MVDRLSTVYRLGKHCSNTNRRKSNMSYAEQ
jgi:hypothetical protein